MNNLKTEGKKILLLLLFLQFEISKVCDIGLNEIGIRKSEFAAKAEFL